MSSATVADEPLRGAGPEGEPDLEQHRVELTAYCYRMLASAFEAEDAVQETMVRAWRGYDRFERRASLRSWLYRIATNVCIDMLHGRDRRARPMDLGPSSTTAEASLVELPDATWVTPVPDHRVIAAVDDPADLAVARETVRLAFVTALQHLPPRQRAVLILREVLRFTAAEVAALLETSVASVNSALQRARSTLSRVDAGAPSEPMDEVRNELLRRYLDAFERYDLDALTSLLHEDATLSMPPYALWLRGRVEVRRWLEGPGEECRGSRMLTVDANGVRGFAQYRPSGPGGRHQPWALQVVEVEDGRVVGINAFLDTQQLFPLFGLPEHPDDEGSPAPAPPPTPQSGEVLRES